MPRVATRRRSGGKRKPFKIKRPGALTRKARRAGQSVNQYSYQHRNDPGLTGKQARFYRNVLRKS